ncbi:MAG: cellulase family glycosylhydrolase, partial [Bacteroidales bacterium]|nr:cellulase family glycosylhydrolase [Bacteroidales bacterium]
PITEYDNLMYTMHFYAATHKDDLRNRTEAAIEAGLPVFISECAAMECTGDGPLDYQSWKEWTDMAARHGVSIVVWSLSDKNESCSMMLPEASSNGPWTEDVTREWGKAVKKWLSE